MRQPLSRSEYGKLFDLKLATSSDFQHGGGPGVREILKDDAVRHLAMRKRMHRWPRASTYEEVLPALVQIELLIKDYHEMFGPAHSYEQDQQWQMDLLEAMPAKLVESLAMSGTVRGLGFYATKQVIHDTVTAGLAATGKITAPSPAQAIEENSDELGDDARMDAVVAAVTSAVEDEELRDQMSDD